MRHFSISRVLRTAFLTLAVLGVFMTLLASYAAVRDERMQIENGWKRHCYDARGSAVMIGIVTCGFFIGALVSHRFVAPAPSKA